jgi:hypothetical protein
MMRSLAGTAAAADGAALGVLAGLELPGRYPVFTVD